MATNPAAFSEAATTLAARISRSCSPRDADEFWRLIRLAQSESKPAS